MKKLLFVLWAALPLAAQIYTFSDGGKPERFEFAPNEAYISFDRATDRSAAMARVKKTLDANMESASETGETGFVVVLSQPAREAVKKLRSGKSQFEAVRSVAPVFYDASEVHRDAARRFVTSRLLVKLGAGGGAWSKLQESTHAQSRKDSLIKGWSLVEYGDPYTALDAADSLTRDGGWEFIPVFAQQLEKRQAKASGQLQRPVNDPLYPNQWHLGGTGPNLLMNAAWDVATGKGINVAVVDDGLDVAHEDLAGNAYPLETNNHRNYNSGPPNDPTPANPGQNHGTNCAGLIAAVGFNNIGVIGVAPEANLMGLRLIAEPSGDDAIADAMSWQPNGLVTHVSSNSWGPADDGKALGTMGALQAAAIAQANTHRNGLGTVFLVSAGNGRQAGDDASYDAFAASRFTIAVGAVGRTGDPSSFSEQGINVAISAFGGEFNPPDVTWTTNNSGADALASLQSKFPTSQAPVNYSDAFNGTSAAAPQVSGAVALLLQANPNLGYRDVKEILMKTATKTGLQNGDAFRDNGAGFSFSHSFGAGLLNVSAALDLAAGWTNLGPLTSITLKSADIAPIPDGSQDGAVFSFDFSAAQKLRVEHVEFIVNVQHPNRGELGFIVTSPSGMTSIVQNRAPDTGANFENYSFTTVRDWGESSTGVWTVRVIDIAGNGVTGTAGNLTMNIWGTAAQ